MTITYKGKYTFQWSHSGPTGASVEVEVTWSVVWQGTSQQLLQDNGYGGHVSQKVSGYYRAKDTDPSAGLFRLGCKAKIVPNTTPSLSLEAPQNQKSTKPNSSELHISINPNYKVKPLTSHGCLAWLHGWLSGGPFPTTVGEFGGDGGNFNVTKGGTKSYKKSWHHNDNTTAGNIPVGGNPTSASVQSTFSVTPAALCPARTTASVQTSRVTTRTGCKPYVDYLQWGKGSAPVVLLLRKNGSVQKVNEVRGGSCAPTSADWVRCGRSGDPTKSWPVMVERGSRLFTTVHLNCASGCQITDGTLRGSVRLSNRGKMLFKVPHVNIHGASGLLIKNAVSTGKLPNHAGTQHVQITWTITQPGKKTLNLGTTTHTIYETLGPPPPFDFNLYFPGARLLESPYLQLVALASQGAQGATSKEAGLNGIWSLFQHPKRDGLHRYDLNASWNVVRSTALLHFWYPHWSLFGQFAGTYEHYKCPRNLEPLLTPPDIATCNAMEQLFVALLRIEGIDAKGAPPNAAPIFGNGWDKLKFPEGAFFLVGQWSWSQRRNEKLGTAAYPYVDQFNYSGGTLQSIKPTEVTFVAAPGQGNPQPPAFWEAHPAANLGVIADHDLVVVGGKVYDPSYGLGPYKDLADWAHHAIVGWAFFRGSNSKKHVSFTKCGKEIPVCVMLIHKGFK